MSCGTPFSEHAALQVVSSGRSKYLQGLLSEKPSHLMDDVSADENVISCAMGGCVNRYGTSSIEHAAVQMVSM